MEVGAIQTPPPCPSPRPTTASRFPRTPRWLEDAGSEDTLGVDRRPARTHARLPCRALPSYDDIREGAQRRSSRPTRSPTPDPRARVREVLRAQGATAQPTAVPRHPRPTSPDTTAERVLARPERYGPERHHHRRLVRPLAGRAASSPSRCPLARTEDGTLHVSHAVATGRARRRADPSQSTAAPPAGRSRGGETRRGSGTPGIPRPANVATRTAVSSRRSGSTRLAGAGGRSPGARRRVRRRSDRGALPGLLSGWPLGLGSRAEGRRRRVAALRSLAHDAGEWWMLARSHGEGRGRCLRPGWVSSCCPRKDAPRGQILKLPMAPGASVADAVARGAALGR